MKKETIDQFISVLPILSISVIALSIVKSGLYFLNFNIPFYYFFNLSELTMLVANDLIIVVMITGITLPIVPYLMNKIQMLVNKKLDKYILPNDNTSITTNTQIQSKSYIVKRLDIITIFIKIIFFSWMAVCLYNCVFSSKFSDSIYYGSLFLSSIGSMLTIRFFYFGSFISKDLIMSIFITLVLVTFSMNISNQISAVEKGKYTGTLIITADSTYKSTDSSFFVGKSESFVFIHNLKDTTNLIIPTSSVTKFILKQK